MGSFSFCERTLELFKHIYDVQSGKKQCLCFQIEREKVAGLFLANTVRKVTTVKREKMGEKATMNME